MSLSQVSNHSLYSTRFIHFIMTFFFLHNLLLFSVLSSYGCSGLDNELDMELDDDEEEVDSFMEDRWAHIHEAIFINHIKIWFAGPITSKQVSMLHCASKYYLYFSNELFAIDF